jgi:hypothetical protein
MITIGHTMDQITEPTPAPTKEVLAAEDRNAFEIAKMRHQMVVRDLDLALAKKETADSEFRYMLLQLYMKYGLSPEKDNIDQNGNITRNKESK